MMKLYTGGTFDLFHAGHAKFLKYCYQITPNVIVALNTDEFVEKYKGSKPILPYEERKIILESCRYVRDVIPNVGNEDSTSTILSVKPHIIAIGTDWASKDYYAQMGFTQEWLDDNGIVLCYLPYGKTHNTTSIKNKIKNK